jgi:nicotinamide-nucleotide adenylyltransferase
MLKWLKKPQSTQSLTILDSSFNPPHNAHLEMLQNSNPLLLFSIKNMDKPTENTLDRIEMIKLLGLPAAITDQGRFVDKVKLFDNPTFIMGYDTLVRFFDPKYYTDFQQEMNVFFATSKIRMFDRGDDMLPIWSRPELQHALQWKDSVEILEKISDISSTKCRKAITIGCDRKALEELMPLAIVEYIIKNRIFQ